MYRYTRLHSSIDINFLVMVAFSINNTPRYVEFIARNLLELGGKLIVYFLVDYEFFYLTLKLTKWTK